MKATLPRFSFWLFSLFFCFPAAAQEAETDSLIQQWNALPDDTGRVNTCIRLVSRLSSGDARVALHYADSGLALAGRLHFGRGYADILNQKAGALMQMGNQEEALKAYLESYDIRRKINDTHGIAGSLNNIGRIHESMQNYPLALSYYRKAVEMNLKSGYKKWLAINYINIGVLYGKQSRIDSAIYYQQKAYEIAAADKDERNMAFCSDNLGVDYTEKGQYEKALQYNLEALRLRRKLGDRDLIALSLNNTGHCYVELKQPDKALALVQEALRLAKASAYTEGEQNAYQYLAEIYDQKKNYKDALRYHRLYLQLRDSMAGIENAEKIAALQAAFDRKMSEKTISDLKTKDQYATRRIEKQKTWIVYGIIALLGILVAAAVFYVRSRFKGRINEQLNSLYKDLETIEAIGKKITASFSVEEINRTVYEEINRLMDASGFGIGLLNEKERRLVFSGYLEKGERLPETVYDLDDKNRLAVWCIDHRKEIFINDFEKEVRNYVSVVPRPVTGEDVHSLIYIPLISKDRLIGTVTVQSFRKNAYTAYHFRLLENIASYTAIALENAMLYENMEGLVQLRTREVILQKEELERNYSNTQLLSEMGQEITSTLKFESIFLRLYENVNRLMPAEVFGVRIYHPEKNAIEYKFEFENGETHPSIWVSMDDDDNYSVWSVKNKKEIFINDNLAEYGKYVKQIRVVAGDMPHSLIFYPMMVGEKVIGVISIQSFSKNAYKPIHLAILKTLASYTAIALENANLYETLEEKVNERTREVLRQKAIIEEKNKDITDSIRYAKKIQTALLPGMGRIGAGVRNFFILYQPRDIVSGDFYYFAQAGPYKIFAVADCTGHGVPGAIISAICINLMTEVVTDKLVQSPGEALEQIDHKLKALLKQEKGGQSNDGMDCGMCVLNAETGELQYAGAHRPMLLIRNGELMEIKSTKHSIGGHDTGKKKFETTRVQTGPGNCFYMFTDGYADQFGGPRGKKFKYRRMQELILANRHVALSDQRDVFHEALLSWKGNFEQVDDILLMGVEV